MRVYFTVDTESSIGGAWENEDRRPLEAVRHVFCRIGTQDFGIPLITQILGGHGFRGTFFVETLATRCLGDRDTRSVFEFLLTQGQDVQLHIHPVYRIYAEAQRARKEGGTVPKPRDFIGEFSAQAQLDYLGEALTFFEQFAGYRPLAFRAGCFSGSRAMLRTLRTLDIKIDSSFNPCYPTISFPGEAVAPNLVQEIEGIWEFPVTVAKSLLPESYQGLKFADCTSLSFEELRAMLDAAAVAGQQHFIIVFHSFSAVKARDVTYTELRPNRIVIRRLKRLCRYLAEHPRQFQVDTLGAVASNLEVLRRTAHASVVPTLSLAQSLTRKTIQLINNVYWV